MNVPAAVDETCAVFNRLPGLDSNAIHRFVVGEDQTARAMSHDEAAQELGDPFATLLLLRGRFPSSAAQVLKGIDEATEEGDPLRNQMSFILGEGSQIPWSQDTDGLNRGLRFVVARGTGVDGPELLVSTFDPDRSFVELMAWDRRANGFNFYRSVGDNNAWVWAGNSRHAISAPTRENGPFESHPTGNFLMKELRSPWINWHSPDANIFPTAFAPTDPRREHPWFTGREPQGALTLETAVARPAIRRWTKARFASMVREGGAVDQPVRIMEQILDTQTVNLITSHTESRKAVTSDSVDLPQTFFVDSEALTEILGLDPPPSFGVSGALYAKSLEAFGFELSDDRGFRRPGDTHFAFMIPERAFEDQEALRHAIEIGLVTERLAACLLMTGFPNPVFSARRVALLEHVPATATIQAGQSSFSEEMAEAILASAERSSEGSSESEFAERWGAGDGWRDAFNRLLGEYYTAVVERLKSQEGFDDYVRLAESRRDRVRAMPIFENRLLFAHTNIQSGRRALRPDGTVETVKEG